jgi:hypothetical protein
MFMAFFDTHWWLGFAITRRICFRNSILWVGRLWDIFQAYIAFFEVLKLLFQVIEILFRTRVI